MISFFLQNWQVRYPMGRGQQGESIKTTFIFWSFFLSPRWDFLWSSENMAKRHFWHIDIFFLKDFLVRIMIWLDAPYNTLEIHTQNIFIIILWVVVIISLRPIRHILTIIPYLDNFLSSPRLGLISLNHSFGRSINSSLGSCLWTNWDHGWVEKIAVYNIPMWCGNFLQQTICGRHPLKATWTNIPILCQFLDFH